MIWRVIDVTNENTIEIWDGKSREKWGAPAGTMMFSIPEHGLVKGDEVVLTVALVNRKQPKEITP